MLGIGIQLTKNTHPSVVPTGYAGLTGRQADGTTVALLGRTTAGLTTPLYGKAA